MRAVGSRRRAFSLVEAICVAALLAMASAVTAASLRAMSRYQGSADQGERLVAELDTTARLAAVRGLPVAVVASGSSLDVRRLDTGASIAARETTGLRLFHGETGEPVATIPFGPAGTSIDYVAVLRSDRATVRLHVSGLSGWIERDSEMDAPR